MKEDAKNDFRQNSVGIVTKQFLTFAEPPDELLLSGGIRLGPVTVAYETCGTLNPTRSNAVLICHALSGDSHVAGFYSDADPKPGWWEFMIGPGKGIDTNKYFVICINILGGCMGTTGPSSPHPVTGKPYGLNFPVVTISDIVKTQKILIDYLGIKQLHAVVGGSVGGMQVLEWSIQFPEMVKAAIPLATTTKHSALAIAFNEVARQAIMADPKWNSGNYYDGEKPAMGLAVARMIGHITYLSDEAMRRKFGRQLQDKTAFSFNFDADFQIESYLRYQGSKFVERFDANSFLYITKAADYFDPEQNASQGSIVELFSNCQARFLVISFTSDWLYPTYQSRAMVKAMKKSNLDVSFCELHADCGHDAFLIPNKRLSTLIGSYLQSVT